MDEGGGRQGRRGRRSGLSAPSHEGQGDEEDQEPRAAGRGVPLEASEGAVRAAAVVVPRVRGLSAGRRVALARVGLVRVRCRGVGCARVGLARVGLDHVGLGALGLAEVLAGIGLVERADLVGRAVVVGLADHHARRLALVLVTHGAGTAVLVGLAEGWDDVFNALVGAGHLFVDLAVVVLGAVGVVHAGDEPHADAAPLDAGLAVAAVGVRLAGRWLTGAAAALEGLDADLAVAAGSEEGVALAVAIDQVALLVHAVVLTRQLALVGLAELLVVAVGVRVALDDTGGDALAEVAALADITVRVGLAAGLEGLAGVYLSIVEELRSGYLIAYQAPSAGAESVFRKIKVEVDAKGARVRTRRGYFP